MVKINKEGKDIFTLSIGAFLAQIVPVVASIILARIYTAEQFGDKGIFLSAAAILAVIVTGQYEMSVVRPEKEEDAHSLIRLCFINVTVISFLITAVIFVSDMLGMKYIEGFPSRYLLPVYVFFLGLFQIYSHYANRKERYKVIASSGVLKNISQDSSRIILGFLKSFGGLIQGACLGVMASIVYCERNISIRHILFGKYDWKRIKSSALRYSYFPMFLLPSALLSNLSVNLPVILLAAYFTKDYIGYFSMTVGLLLLPVQLVGTAMGKVFYKKASDSSDTDEVGRFALNLFRVSFFVGLAMNLLLIPFGEFLFSLVLGGSWHISGLYAGILAPWVLLTLVFSPLSVIFDARDKQYIELAINAVSFISRILVIWIGGAVLHDMEVTVLLYCISGIIVWIIEGVSIFKLTGIRIPFRLKVFVSLSMALVIILWILKLNTAFGFIV